MSMKKILLLLAGYPGTGKSYFANMLDRTGKKFYTISPDEMKEQVWDEDGFDTLEEKEKTLQKAWKRFYTKLRQCMEKEIDIVSDYPFSEKQKSNLALAAEQYGYDIITIRFTAELKTLFQRQKERDLDESRHLGHILNCYHKGMTVQDRTKAEGILEEQEFFKRCKERGYDTFSLGTLIEVDTTDFSKVPYDSILKSLKEICFS